MLYNLDIFPVVVSGRRYRLPPNQNSRLHWAARSRASKAFEEQVYYKVKALKIPRQKKIKIHATEYAIRFTDDDNLVASLKCLRDTIVRAGVVPDDSPEYVQLGNIYHDKVDHREDESLSIMIEPI